jgi:hypothetical protein
MLMGYSEKCNTIITNLNEPSQEWINWIKSLDEGYRVLLGDKEAIERSKQEQWDRIFK